MKTIAKSIVVFLILFSCTTARSQNFNLEPGEVETYQVGIKANIPQFKKNEYNNFAPFTGLYTANLQVSLKKNWSLYGELPFAFAKNDYESSSGFGNLFLIARKSLNDAHTSRISFGTYLPIISSGSYYTQEIILSGNIYRISQALSAYTIYANYSYTLPKIEKPIFGFEFGPDIMIPRYGGETELFVHLGLKGGYKFNKFWVWSEFNGIMIVSESGIDFNNRLISQVVFGAQIDLGKFKPGLFYSIPLKEYMREYEKGVIGVKLDFGI